MLHHLNDVLHNWTLVVLIQVALMLWRILAHLIKPSSADIGMGILFDPTRGNAYLIAENVLFRHQLIILRRSIKKPHRDDRLMVIALSRLNKLWQNAS